MHFLNDMVLNCLLSERLWQVKRLISNSSKYKRWFKIGGLEQSIEILLLVDEFKKNLIRQLKAHVKQSKGEKGEEVMSLAITEVTDRVVDALVSSG